jgi:high-affinity Fe2+/Pb2+ permease
MTKGKKRNSYPMIVIVLLTVALLLGTGVHLLFDNIGLWQAIGITALALSVLLLERGIRGRGDR